MLAQLMSDDPHIDIQFGIFTGTTKNSTMYLVRNFGHMCLLCSLDKVCLMILAEQTKKTLIILLRTVITKIVKRLPRDYQETTKTPPRDYQGKEKNTVEIIREIMVGNPYITAKEIAEAVGLTVNGVQYHIKKMKSSGKLERQGGDYGGRWIVK